MKREAVSHQRSAYACSAAGGVDEQRLHVAVVDQHECLRIIIGVDRKPERHLGEKAAHHLVDGLAIFG